MKPCIPHEFFVNDDLGALTLLHRILFLGLLMLSASDDGLLEDRPRRIQAQVLPYNPEADVDAMLNELARAGLIIRREGENPNEIDLIVIDDFDTRWQVQETDPSN